MTVREMIQTLGQFDPDAKIFVGCQGYTNAEDPAEEYEIRVTITRVMKTKKGVLISDGCGYEEELARAFEW